MSTLICSGQITRDEALEGLNKPLYEKGELERDKQYVLKKLGLTEEEFTHLMNLLVKKHQDFQTEDWIYSLITRLKKFYSFLIGQA